MISINQSLLFSTNKINKQSRQTNVLSRNAHQDVFIKNSDDKISFAAKSPDEIKGVVSELIQTLYNVVVSGTEIGHNIPEKLKANDIDFAQKPFAPLNPEFSRLKDSFIAVKKALFDISVSAPESQTKAFDALVNHADPETLAKVALVLPDIRSGENDTEYIKALKSNYQKVYLRALETRNHRALEGLVNHLQFYSGEELLGNYKKLLDEADSKTKDALASNVHRLPEEHNEEVKRILKTLLSDADERRLRDLAAQYDLLPLEEEEKSGLFEGIDQKTQATFMQMLAQFNEKGKQ